MTTLPPPVTDKHPGAVAADLCRQYVEQCACAKEKRAAAAALRKEAKAATLKADAYALREKARPLSNEAFAHRAKSKQLLQELTAKATDAKTLLTARMPTEWSDWGFVKTRAYASLLQTLVVQTGLVHPKPPVIADTLSHLLSHRDWDDQLLQELSVKPTASRNQFSETT